MIDLTYIELKENNSPKEPGFYISSYLNKKTIIQVCRNGFGDLVILQAGTNRLFECTDTDKNFFFSDRLELGNPKSDFVIP